MMTLGEYCQNMGISRRTAYRQLTSGKLRGVKIDNGDWRIPDAEYGRLLGKESETLGAEITARILDKSISDLEQCRVAGYIDGVSIDGEWRYTPEAISDYIRSYG